MGKAEFHAQLCKGCGYCIRRCPKQVLEWSGQNNQSGYPYPVQKREGCTGCGICYQVCPDCAITVYR